MSWAVGFDSNWSRDIGYGVVAHCDHPDCNRVIDRGLGFVCGGEPYGGDHGCGLYFCGNHLSFFPQLCERCMKNLEPFNPKPDHPIWTHHKEIDPSWEAWRQEQSKK